MDFKTILEAVDLNNKRVLVRVDWNVPIQNGLVTDDFRIRESLPTIELLLKNGAKVTLICHLETLSNGGVTEESSLEPVYECAKKLLPSLVFKESGDLVLLENLRQNVGEKENSREFALSLSQNQDIFVNEAFSASHREHASIVGIPKLLPSFAGLRFTEEVKRLSKAFYPKRPFLFILGGAKFDTKLPLIDKFVNIADTLFIGGALAHNFFKEMGNNLGDSLVSSGNFNLMDKYNTGKIVLPNELVIRGHDGMRAESIEHVSEGDIIVDAGARTLELLKTKIHDAQFILWNGPLGNYEQGFKEGTLGLARLLSESDKEVILGGADTIACIKELGLYSKFSFVSTGGGAMLDFLSTGTLPGIEALKRI